MKNTGNFWIFWSQQFLWSSAEQLQAGSNGSNGSNGTDDPLFNADPWAGAKWSQASQASQAGVLSCGIHGIHWIHISFSTVQIHSLPHGSPVAVWWKFCWGVIQQSQEPLMAIAIAISNSTWRELSQDFVSALLILGHCFLRCSAGSPEKNIHHS